VTRVILICPECGDYVTDYDMHDGLGTFPTIDGESFCSDKCAVRWTLANKQGQPRVAALKLGLETDEITEDDIIKVSWEEGDFGDVDLTGEVYAYDAEELTLYWVWGNRYAPDMDTDGQQHVRWSDMKDAEIVPQ
jgi:hypothetical protein